VSQDTVTVDQVIQLLNVAVVLDEQAMRLLFSHRTPCNLLLQEHPTIQVMATKEGGRRVGILGILNGMFGVRADGWGEITARFERVGDNAQGRLLGFERTAIAPAPAASEP